MATSYPAGYDALANPGTNLSSSPLHSVQHTNLNDAMEAVQAELGLNPSGSAATVAARLDSIEPIGTKDHVALTSSHGSITTITDISFGGTPLSVTWTASASRRYRTTFSGEINGTSAGALLIVYITDGSNNIKRRHVITVPALVSGVGYTGVQFSVVESGLTGSTTRKIRLERNAGSGTAEAYAATSSPMSILVEDIGPA